MLGLHRQLDDLQRLEAEVVNKKRAAAKKKKMRDSERERNKRLFEDMKRQISDLKAKLARSKSEQGKGDDEDEDCKVIILSSCVYAWYMHMLLFIARMTTMDT